MKTTASLFTGGALFDIGAMQAGYTPIWGIEKFDNIAAVARKNNFPVITADVTEVDFSKMERPDHLHASPPCPNFSIAKAGAEETELDIALADAVCRSIRVFKPETFTLENVVGYRHSQSFKRIIGTLSDLGYWFDVSNLNAADFGVPQTRIRLMVRASRGLLHGYPPPVKWRGWYEAIEDLIDELPDAEFAPWQVARLPKEYKEFMIGQGTYSPALEPHEPAQTITSNNNQNAIKAFIMSSGNNSFQDAKEGGGVPYAAEPVMTMMAGKTESKIKAFVIGSGNSNANGRVVKMNIKALGRFQTVPDWYQGLTVKINGNGVPCLMAQKVLETLA